MRRKGILRKLVVLSTVLCLGLGSIPAQAAAIPTAAEAAEQKEEIKNGWVKEKIGYCYYKNGKKLTKWQTIAGKKYYLGTNGARKTGWYSMGSKSYYFDSKGVYKKSKAIDAKLLSTMDKVIKAQKITDSTADKTALKKLDAELKKKDKKGKYVYGYKNAMGFHPATAKKGWENKFAKEMIVGKKGSCYHDAAAFAFLAKRATGLPVRICLGNATLMSSKKWQEHGWVEIKIGKTWYTYDANADKYAKLRKGKWLCQKRSAMEGKIYKTQKTFNVEL